MDKTLKRVGYIGMGIMGQPMAMNLLKAGFEVTVWNRTLSKCEPLREAGAAVAESPADLAGRGVDVICMNVTDTPDVEAVLMGDEGVVKQAREGLIVIDHSTISPEATQKLGAALGARGITLLDAPVSGGDVGARNGTLSIMVGGEREAFDRCGAIFEAVGGRITHVGACGMGQVCKACNQIAVSCALMGVCEALGLAKKSGLSLEKMVEVVSAGAGGSWQLENLGPKVASGDHDPGFMIDLILKDLNIVKQSAESRELPLAGTAAAMRYFEQAAELGAGRLGTQAMARAVEAAGGFAFADGQ